MSKHNGKERKTKKQAKAAERMSRARATEILGIEWEADPEEVRTAYRISLVRMRKVTGEDP
jgi:hypothetical protein